MILLLMSSTFNFSTAATMLPAIGSAKVAGKMAFDIINHVPGVQSNEPGT